MPTATDRDRVFGLLLAFSLITPLAQAQTSEALSIQVEPASLNLDVGESAQLEARVVDAEGAEREAPILFFSRDRRSVGVDSAGQVMA